ncbi:2-oxo-4-hydroxy-4-carboxy-5-ureidoimidazoline decarboxylase [Gracilibacillus lacisalsi]|uniref:2-oxo-4-hydroxy-4-carboxy-5-ureidoimidazoline decarboxylase n=1 Tax=Gracilibacillus lacisalsi TaxID=393087 RepID=UPI00036512E5|nr:2-oxo-4-hydroxy-4-carboxy-5-ureidoimidazoline decarboxylase [Gracilibacillus lacisalsi]
MRIEDLNAMSKEEFVETLGSVFEQSPWIAIKAVEDRPYDSVEDLHQRMVEIVRDSTREEKLELIRSHPNLGERLKMSDDSVKEQQGAGLQNLDELEYKKFQTLNYQYSTKFEFPFIIAVKGRTKEEIFNYMCERILKDPAIEFEQALKEIYQIARFRLEEQIIM